MKVRGIKLLIALLAGLALVIGMSVPAQAATAPTVVDDKFEVVCATKTVNFTLGNVDGNEDVAVNVNGTDYMVPARGTLAVAWPIPDSFPVGEDIFMSLFSGEWSYNQAVPYNCPVDDDECKRKRDKKKDKGRHDRGKGKNRHGKHGGGHRHH